MQVMLDREPWCAHLTTLGLVEKTVVVAVSGGPDSLALLDLLADVRERQRLVLHVGHADHGIHPASATVAQTVQELCRTRYDLPCHVERLHLGEHASETIARHARYRWLWQLVDTLGPKDDVVLVTAHHRDDQIETILMRALEGTGVAGLAGMAERRGRLIRPVLSVPQKVLRSRVAQRGLKPWFDPANVATRNLRSWIRQEVLPAVRARYPDVDRGLQRLGEAAARDRQAWNTLLEESVDLEYRDDDGAVSVAAGALKRYDSVLSSSVISALARRAGVVVGFRRATAVIAMVKRAQSGRRIELGEGWVAELSFGRVAIRAPMVSAPCEPCTVTPGDASVGPWRLRCEVGTAPTEIPRAGNSTWVPPGPLVVRPWKPGDRIRPLKGVGERPVARCLQEARIPVSARTGWPVVVDGCGRPLWVAGVCRGSQLIPAPGTEAWHINVGFS